MARKLHGFYVKDKRMQDIFTSRTQPEQYHKRQKSFGICQSPASKQCIQSKKKLAFKVKVKV